MCRLMLFILYCRLVLGTLYPAYASYKAVKTKNVKEYVSRVICVLWETALFYLSVDLFHDLSCLCHSGMLLLLVLMAEL